MTEAQRKVAALPDGAVSYLEWANGQAAPLHFAHANGFNAETYRTLLQPLAERFHIFAWDQRGAGFSTLPATPDMAAGWTIFRDDLLKFLARVTDRPVILAGHSMGATASLMAAATMPSKVAALVLVEPVLVPYWTKLTRFLPRAWRDGSGSGLAERTLQRRNEFPSFEAARDAYRGRGAFKTWPETVLADYLKGGLVPDGKGAVRLACEPAWEAAAYRGAPFGTAHASRRVKCPITILYGTEASTSRSSEIARISRFQPGARVVRVEGATHFLPMEKPCLVREEITRIAEQIAAS
jgi:pimeloyl-ACP methyl ester carboxylesterase